MSKPLAIDLYCGLGGWAEGLLAEGYRVIGFDIERHDYGTGGYPGQLVLQDVTTLHGSQFKDAAVIVASPPCQAYSYRAMPWKRAKALPLPDNTLFETCFRLQREATEANARRCNMCQGDGFTRGLCRCESCDGKGSYARYIPLVVENVKGAQPWVGRAAWHYGSFYLWGDVPALMPITLRTVKVEGMNFHEYEKTGKPGRSFQSAAVESIKNGGGSWFAIANNTTSGHRQNPDGRKINGPSRHRELKAGEFGHKTIMADGTSKSAKRKAASAQIAKIPFPLASHIGRVFRSAGEQGAAGGEG